MDSIDIEENELVLWIFINIIDIYLYFYVMCWDFDLWIILIIDFISVNFELLVFYKLKCFMYVYYCYKNEFFLK